MTTIESIPIPYMRVAPINRIIDAVCSATGVMYSELGNDERSRPQVLARELVSMLARRHTALSYPQIAKAIGKPRHTTIIASQRRGERRCEENPDFKLTYEATEAAVLETRSAG